MHILSKGEHDKMHATCKQFSAFSHVMLYTLYILCEFMIYILHYILCEKEYGKFMISNWIKNSWGEKQKKSNRI